MEVVGSTAAGRTGTAWKEIELPADNNIDRLDVESKIFLLDSISKRLSLRRTKLSAESQDAELCEREVNTQSTYESSFYEAQRQLQTEVEDGTLNWHFEILEHSLQARHACLLNAEVMESRSYSKQQKQEDVGNPTRGLVGLDISVKLGLRVKPAHSGCYNQCWIGADDCPQESPHSRDLQGYITRVCKQHKPRLEISLSECAVDMHFSQFLRKTKSVHMYYYISHESKTEHEDSQEIT
eukprot:758680-Hanusia_phi.AAC.3